jgi:hypothetical protein
MAAGAAIANFTQLDMHRKLGESKAAPVVSWALLIGAVVFAAVRPKDFGPVWLTLCSAGLLYGVLLNKGFQRALSLPISQLGIPGHRDRPFRPIVTNGMNAPTRNGIDVPKWRC